MRALKFAALGAALAMCLTAVPHSAQALEWNVGGYVKGGGACPTDNDADDQYNVGFGGGFQFFGLVKVAYNFAVGGDFDFMYHAHTDISGQYQFGIISTALGLKARLQLPQFDFGVKLNYVHGFIDGPIDGAGQIVENKDFPGYDGFLLGADILYRFQLAPYRTFLEGGFYVDYMYLGEGDINATHLITFGIQAGVTFEFGRFVPGGQPAR